MSSEVQNILQSAVDEDPFVSFYHQYKIDSPKDYSNLKSSLFEGQEDKSGIFIPKTDTNIEKNVLGEAQKSLGDIISKVANNTTNESLETAHPTLEAREPDIVEKEENDPDKLLPSQHETRPDNLDATPTPKESDIEQLKKHAAKMEIVDRPQNKQNQCFECKANQEQLSSASPPNQTPVETVSVQEKNDVANKKEVDIKNNQDLSVRHLEDNNSEIPIDSNAQMIILPPANGERESVEAVPEDPLVFPTFNEESIKTNAGVEGGRNSIVPELLVTLSRKTGPAQMVLLENSNDQLILNNTIPEDPEQEQLGSKVDSNNGMPALILNSDKIDVEIKVNPKPAVINPPSFNEFISQKEADKNLASNSVAEIDNDTKVQGDAKVVQQDLVLVKESPSSSTQSSNLKNGEKIEETTIVTKL